MQRMNSSEDRQNEEESEDEEESEEEEGILKARTFRLYKTVQYYRVSHDNEI